MAALKHFIGSGVVYVGGRDVGNASDVSVNIDQEEKTVSNFRGGGGNAASTTRITAVNLAMTLYDFNAENLSLALRGTTNAEAATPITGEVLTFTVSATNDVLIPTVQVINTTVAPVVTGTGGTPTRTVDVDYTVTASGIIAIAGGAMVSGDEVDYTPLATTKMEALTTSGLEFEVVVDGTNDSEAEPFRFIGYKFKPSPTSGLSLISDDYASFPVEGELILDTTKVGAGISQYFKHDT